MLKSQDAVVLVKLAAHLDEPSWSQRQLAQQLCISVSEINASLKRLSKATLIQKDIDGQGLRPVTSAALEYILHGIKYQYPVILGEYTRGIATSFAAPVFKDKVVIGNEPIPVWPSATGDARGFALEPLYKSVPKAIQEHPDKQFYDLLSLIDVMRQGRARERKIATEMIKECMS